MFCLYIIRPISLKFKFNHYEFKTSCSFYSIGSWNKHNHVATLPNELHEWKYSFCQQKRYLESEKGLVWGYFSCWLSGSAYFYP